jgi:hypothetical protein
MQLVDIKVFIEFMVAGNGDHLLKVVGSPRPEWMFGIVVVA